MKAAAKDLSQLKNEHLSSFKLWDGLRFTVNYMKIKNTID